MRDAMRVERMAVRQGVLHARPDLVHAHWCYEYALGALATGLPALVTVRDWIPAILRHMPPRALPYWSGRALMYFTTLACARYLTANSPYTAGRVRPYTRAAVEVVPNGIPDRDFATGDREEPGAGRSARSVIVAVNNGFTPRKNVSALLIACRVLRQEGLDLDVRLIGDGFGPGEACSVWARARRLDDGVTFAGVLSHDEVGRAMREATVYAHPSREESFGATLIEAMSQRLPVVAGVRSGAVPWVLDNGNAGLLVDVDDPGALASGLRAVITRPDLRAHLAAAGYRRAWGSFRQSRVTDLYEDVYRRVLAEEAV
jgi:glycosyltransferase involved in cell wall biosynthesis